MGNHQSGHHQTSDVSSVDESEILNQVDDGQGQDDNFKVTISDDFASTWSSFIIIEKLILRIIFLNVLLVIDEIIAKLSNKDGVSQDVVDQQHLELAERKKQYAQKLEAWREWNTTRQEELDSKIDTLSAKYDDLMVEIKYDSGLLEKSWKDPLVSYPHL